MRLLPVEQVVEACVAQGAVDGLSSRPEPLEDGAPLHVSRSLIDRMHFLINQAEMGWVGA